MPGTSGTGHRIGRDLSHSIRGWWHLHGESDRHGQRRATNTQAQSVTVAAPDMHVGDLNRAVHGPAEHVDRGRHDHQHDSATAPLPMPE
jgi:hypothetical protein